MNLIYKKLGANKRLLFFLAAIAWFFSFSLHPRHAYNTWEGPLWADGAGYFVYLPASFYYDFDAHAFPDDIEAQMGLGFTLQADGKVFTKYTYGVALMQLPVYALIDGWVRLRETHLLPKGFTVSHQRTALVAPVLWLLLGFWWLLQWLQRRFQASVVRWVVTALFLGSHLFYYVVDSGAMSHVYSFALFAGLLLLLDGIENSPKAIKIYGRYVLVGFVAGLILVIRPTNAIFVLFVFFANAAGWQSLGQKFLFWMNGSRIALLLLGLGLAFLPQLLYWKYLSGSWIYYSYQQEGFYWLKPALAKFLFAPAGGLFLYAPVYWLAIPGWWFWYKSQPYASFWALLFFLGSIYVFSCWHSWNYGGSFGARPLVEYLVLTAPAFAHYVKACLAAELRWRRFGLLLLLLLVLWNLKFSLSFNKYFFGTGDWDWQTYWGILFK